MAFKDNSPFNRRNPTEISPEDMEKLARVGVRILLFVPILLLVLWGTLTSFYTVDTEERGVVLRFGNYLKEVDPGLHFKLPLFIDRVELIAAPQRVLKEEFGFRSAAAHSGERTQYSEGDYSGESLMLTGDLNIIDVQWVVQYNILNPRDYLFNIREPQETLRAASEAVMRAIVGNRLASNILTRERVEIAIKARDDLQKIMDGYNSGINITTIELQDVIPPIRVQPAFNEVNVSRQERERMINEAEKRRNQQIPRIEGQALQIIAEAQGYAAERVNRAKGQSSRFTAILKEYEGAPEVTRRRLYLETITELLPNVGHIYVIPEDGSSAPIPLLNLGEDTSRPFSPAPQGGKK